MAKVLKNGLLSGRVGNLVYFVINGKQYVRSWVRPANPKTPGQLRQRSKMKACGKFFSPLKNVIMIGYQGAAQELEEYNESVKYHLDNAMEEITQPGSSEYIFRVIPEQVRLSRGFIQKPQIYTCERTGQEITVTWNPDLGPLTNRLADALSIIAYIQGKKPFSDFHTGTRDEGTGTIVLPADYHEPAHLWAFYWNGQKSAEPDRRNVSDSVYLGMF